MATDRSTDQPSPSRLESFSDGVIAVIITIMVLNFKLPSEPGPAAFVASTLPTLAIYLLSFTFTGIYWINHHHLVHRIKRVDAPILYANLVLLFCLSMLPFGTSYVLNERFDSFSVAVYACALFISSGGFLFLSVAITRQMKLAGDNANSEQTAIQEAELRNTLMSLGLYALAIPVAYWHPFVGVACIALVTLFWIVPGFLLTWSNDKRSSGRTI